jgi:hypothetical protein
MKRWTFSSTWSGWSEVRARMTVSGSRCFQVLEGGVHGQAELVDLLAARIWMLSVTARVRGQLPSRARRVKKFRYRAGALVRAHDVTQVGAGSRRPLPEATGDQHVPESPARS